MSNKYYDYVNDLQVKQRYFVKLDNLIGCDSWFETLKACKAYLRGWNVKYHMYDFKLGKEIY